jgi:hypothetical protein
LTTHDADIGIERALSTIEVIRSSVSWTASTGGAPRRVVGGTGSG